jgi:hypothetical protein
MRSFSLPGTEFPADLKQQHAQLTLGRVRLHSAAVSATICCDGGGAVRSSLFVGGVKYA